MNNNEIMLDYTRIFDYKEIKARLQQNGRKCRHFTKAFLTMYAKARQDIQTNDANGIDTGYYDGIIYTRHEYDDIRQTAFYKVESGSYCEFLSIAHEIEEKAMEQERRKEGRAA